ncbi:MAG TPA: cytidine deaminase [Ideonella sp.]|uniref:cytidine deaminase n=1 Tax=Ideonella sp. TaxID=1929293 RepID=UPI002E37EA33|nr:cytidine deaminase [Ideonella sp.]HEX5686301.1 cytidine deaminase [Ideonella sp.]
MIDESHWNSLLAAARAAREQAYAPYSRFRVGAALLDEAGRVHGGCNVENAAYPEGVCAEAGALSALVLAGGRQIIAAVVVGEGAEPVTPCGGCRQKLREFADATLPIRIADGQGWRGEHTLAALLPASFGPTHLTKKDGRDAAS